jgi:hypothetical protein
MDPFATVDGDSRIIALFRGKKTKMVTIDSTLKTILVQYRDCSIQFLDVAIVYR